MTKKELATKIVAACNGTQAHGITAGAVEDVITATIGVIKDVVYCHGEVTLRGFGTFGHKNRQSQDRPEYQYRRSRTRSGSRRRQFQTFQRFHGSTGLRWKRRRK